LLEYFLLGTITKMRKIDTDAFTKGTRSTPRLINLQIALNLVREHQPISRADLARRMDVGRGMITPLVHELLRSGVVYEGDTVDAPRGRKPTMLYVRTWDRLAIAVDVRFSRTYVMLGDFDGTQLAIESFETIVDSDALVAELGTRIRRLLQSSHRVGTCEGIGLVVPGSVDQRSGRIYHSPQLGWRDVDIRDALQSATGLPVHVENAPHACALAETWLGKRRNGDFAYVTVSDGVGVGMVVDGEVMRGHSHTAGEFGHIPITLDGPRCLCGSLGCLEAFTSNLATLSRYLGRELFSPPEMRKVLRSSGLTIQELIRRARMRDERAIHALQETGSYLGRGLLMIIHALNPHRILVGGEITAAWDLIEPRLSSLIQERALTPAAAATPIIPEQSEVSPRLRGGIALVAAPIFAAPEVA
jgi:N-acetylglucosamine repressor